MSPKYLEMYLSCTIIDFYIVRKMNIIAQENELKFLIQKAFRIHMIVHFYIPPDR